MTKLGQDGGLALEEHRRPRLLEDLRGLRPAVDGDAFIAAT